MMFGATTPVGSLVRMSRVWKCGHALRRRHVHLPREEERQVAREGRLDAVRPLVQEDAVPAAHDRAVVVERQRKSGARRQPHACSGSAARGPSRPPPT